MISYTFDLCGQVGDKKVFTRPIWPAGEHVLTAIGARVQIFNL